MDVTPVWMPAKQQKKDGESSVPDGAPLRDRVIAALRTVYDPELPVNIYDLGLIYRIDIDDAANVDIDMTLTAPGCPVAGSLPGQVECAVREVNGIGRVQVELVWEPPWDQSRMADEARLLLGMF